MARLKNVLKYKLKGSSITEVIVATTILLTVFGIAMITLNNIMTSSIKKDTSKIETELEKLIYKYQNETIKIPSSYSDGNYLVNIQKVSEQDIQFIEFTITDSNTQKSITKKQLVYEE